MSNGQNGALSKAFIDRGKKLLDETEHDMKDNDGKCTVSPSLPWLVRWLVEAKVAEFENEPEPSQMIQIGRVRAKGQFAINALLATGVALFIIEKLAGLLGK